MYEMDIIYGENYPLVFRPITPRATLVYRAISGLFSCFNLIHESCTPNLEVRQANSQDKEESD